VIIVSACYSGSLIPALQAPRRIIIAAARADRSSFGCDASSRHTFFGSAELLGFAEPHRSLHQVFAAIRQDVTRMERAERYRASEPQVFVGSEMTGLYEAPLF
jgi:Peptidase C13 family